MIKSNELRIWNLLHDFHGRVVKVKSIYSGGIRCTYEREDTQKTHTSLYDLSELHPIPLTPEILEKCGFDKDADRFSQNINPFFPNSLIYNKKEAYWEDYESYYGIKTPIKYLHELQNLFYALTGQELEIKL